MRVINGTHTGIYTQQASSLAIQVKWLSGSRSPLPKLPETEPSVRFLQDPALMLSEQLLALSKTQQNSTANHFEKTLRHLTEHSPRSHLFHMNCLQC